MDIASLFLSNLATSTKMWNFSGNFTEEEKTEWDNLMSQYEPLTRDGGGWNYWIIYIIC